MDIITDFGSVVPGSSPGGSTNNKNRHYAGFCCLCGQREFVTSRSLSVALATPPRRQALANARLVYRLRLSILSGYYKRQRPEKLSLFGPAVLVRPERIELSTNPWQGLVIPLNHGRILDF